MHLDHCGSVFRDHTTARHENISLEDDSKIHGHCHLQKQGFPFRTKPCLDLPPPWPLLAWTRSWGSFSHLNLMETVKGFSHRSDHRPARCLSFLLLELPLFPTSGKCRGISTMPSFSWCEYRVFFLQMGKLRLAFAQYNLCNLYFR